MRLGVRHVLYVAGLLAQALLSEGKGKDYYGELGLKKNASEAAIKKAYRCVCMFFFEVGRGISLQRRSGIGDIVHQHF